jgi:hypothetical protein
MAGNAAKPKKTGKTAKAHAVAKPKGKAKTATSKA